MESRIIFSLDLKEYEESINLAKLLGNEIFAIKVGYPLLLSQGIKIVKELSKYSKIICDLKLADIPNTNKIITRIAKDNNAYGIISHVFTGSDSLKAVIEEFKPGLVFGVVEMSHEGSLQFIQGHSLEMAKMAIELGIDGFIVPGTRPERIKMYRELSKNLLLLAPGIGAQGGDPVEAIKSGADYLIIGRYIYESKDPLKTVIELNERINKHL
ncbi:MAG: orotidine-5'-phosphate decarboxylase [Thermoplasmata archaeon]|jgi:orotidine-5'-phosphate decarboxylase